MVAFWIDDLAVLLWICGEDDPALAAPPPADPRLDPVPQHPADGRDHGHPGDEPGQGSLHDVCGHGFSVARCRGIARYAGSGDDDGVAAVVVVVSFIAFWWIATHGKGGVPGRIIAWGTVILVTWVLVAVTNPAAAGDVATGAASGTSAAVTGLGHFIADVFS
jgi:hypothetical protein